MVADIFEDTFGDKHTAWFADRFYTGGYIQSIAKSIGSVITDVAYVDADADRDRFPAAR